MDMLLMSQKNTILGSISSVAPEVIRGEEYDISADMWSLGVIYYEMITGELPFSTIPTTAQVKILHQ